jgi:hypothetical protein
MTDQPPRPRMSAADFDTALRHLGMGVNDAARALDYDRRRVARWLSGDEDIPHVVSGYLKLALSLIALKRLWFERHGVNLVVTVARNTLVETLGSDYPELHAVEDSGEDWPADELTRDMD